jgi:peroxisomal 3,2-trans-enoyl-CoA isomerase
MTPAIPKLDTIEVKLHPTGVAEIIFNRPDRYNLMNNHVYGEWLAALDWAAACDEVKVTVITGRGKYYSSGKQLAMPEPMPASSTYEEKIAISSKSVITTKALVSGLINFPKLLIAAINGPAFGIAVTSMALCDVVYSVPHATFKTPFMQLGLCAEACSSVLFPHIMGPSRASEMLLMGREFTAAELEQCGLVGRILPEDGFHEHVLKLAADAAKFSLDALKTTKKLIRDVDREMLMKTCDSEFDSLAVRRISSEAIEGIRKFIEKSNMQKQQKKQRSAKL